MVWGRNASSKEKGNDGWFVVSSPGQTVRRAGKGASQKAATKAALVAKKGALKTKEFAEAAKTTYDKRKNGQVDGPIIHYRRR